MNVRPNFSPYKPTAGAKEVVADLIDQAGGVKACADALGLDKSQVYNFADAAHDARMSFERVALLTSPKSPAAAVHLAERAGGYFVPMENRGDTLATALCRLAKEMGDVTTAVVMGSADGAFCANDKEELRRELRDAVNAIVRAQQAIELKDPVKA